MDKVLTYTKSRTVWTIIALVLINGVPAIMSFIPEAFQPIVNSILGLLAIYFRANPKADK